MPPWHAVRSGGHTAPPCQPPGERAVADVSLLVVTVPRMPNDIPEQNVPVNKLFGVRTPALVRSLA